MEQNIQIVELEKSLKTLQELTEKISKNIENIDIIIKENINSGAGIWDSESASLYKIKWENVFLEFPQIIETFKNQESNLQKFIMDMKKIDE